MKLHHANILIGGDKEAIFEVLRKNLNFEAKGNPDFYLVQSLTFGINDARDLKRWAAGKPFIGENKVCLLAAQSITHDAQNAMLKTLEEPASGTYIFIIVPNLSNLLPTFLSRARILRIEEKEESKLNAAEFLNSKIRERLKIIQNLHRGKEGKEVMRDLIKYLEKEAYKNNADRKKLKNILTAKTFSTAAGSSPRVLLEWLSGVL